MMAPRLALLLVAAMLLAGCGDSPPAPVAGKRLVVFGCDGVEPALVQRLISDGRLPNLAALARQGGFKSLGTSVPPQSPVAWSNFITGADGGTHGIFDFIHRQRDRETGLYDPAGLYFSTSEDRPGAKPVEIGRYEIPKPWSPPETVLLRDGEPFWNPLDAAGVPVWLFRLPANYPPSASTHGHMRSLSGMGTPDLLSTQGTFQYFSRDTDVPYGGVKSGGGYRLRVKYGQDDIQTATLLGPPNPFVKGNPETTLTLRIFPDDREEAARIDWVNESLFGNDHRELLLKAGEWSGWQPVAFKTVPWIQPGGMTAMAQFYLKQVHPKIRLYVSPLNFDPSAPLAAVSEPPEFATEVAAEVGSFATIGFAEAFKGLSLSVLSEDEFKTQAYAVFDEQNRLLDYALKHYRDGFLFYYFSGSDLVAHMFWWQGQQQHPTRATDAAARYDAVVADLYERIDAAIGRAMKQIGPEATYIVMSDHGFNNWGRQVNINNWLRDNGYLVPKDPHAKWSNFVDRAGRSNTDWSKTRAYAIGINGIYINLKGREKDGSVEPGPTYDLLLDEISRKLLDLTDAKTGEKVVRTVYRARDVYHGPHVVDAPDLVVGYNGGYRVSGSSGLGEFENDVVSDNLDAWSADHCIAAELVPGILISNRPITHPAPSLIDLAPTILTEFGLAPPAPMRGRSVFAPPAVASK